MASKSNTFLWKDRSEGKNRGLATIMLPSSLTNRVNQVVVQTSSGQTIPIQYDKTYEDGRGIYRTKQTGASFGQNAKVLVTLDDGQQVSWDVANPARRYEANYTGGTSNTASPSTKTPTVNAGGFVEYGDAGWANIAAPSVDYAGALARAQELGVQNKESYFGNINDPRTKQTALGLIDTDIEGITRGVNALAPMARAQGQQDLETNISRAGRIDQSNLSRIPAFNQFNQYQAEQANKYNQAQKAKAVEATGVRYKERMTSLLDSLAQQSQGKLPSDMDEALTASARNRGADFSSAAGISAISGAGVRAQDRLNILERLNIMQNAQGMIPGVLQNAQATLYSEPDRAPTIYGQPTQVPLQTSNIEARMPIQSGISAGQAQLGIGTSATNYEIIPAVTSLGMEMDAQRYNASGQYNRDIAVTGQEQDIMNSNTGAYQKALNVKAENLQNEQIQKAKENAMIMEGLAPIIGDAASAVFDYATGQPASETSGVGGFVRGVLDTISPSTGSQGGTSGTVTSTAQGGYQVTPSGYSSQYSTLGTPSGGAPIVSSGGGGNVMVDSLGGSGANVPQTGAYSSGQAVARGVSNVASSIGGALSSSFNYLTDLVGKSGVISGITSRSAMPSFQDTMNRSTEAPPGIMEAITKMDNSPITMGDLKTNVSEYNDFIKKSSSVFDGTDKLSNMSSLKDGTNITKPTNPILDKASSPAPDSRVDFGLVTQTASTVANLNNMSASQQVENAGNLGVNALASKRLISKEEAGQMTRVTDALGTILNPNATEAQKATAIAQATAGMTTMQFTGNPNSPNTIGGNPVVGSTTTENGQEAFMVRQPDGSIANISKQEIGNSSSIASGLSVASVLTSKASDEQKALALSSIGVNSAQAKQLISEVNAGNVSAVLSLFQTGSNWENMNVFQKAISTAQTSQAVLQATSKMLPAQASESMASAFPSSSVVGETLGKAVGTAGALYGIYSGTKGAYTTLKALDDMSRSKAPVKGAKNMAMSGAQAGAGIGTMILPGVGTAIGAGIGAAVGAVTGAIAGATGTGKGTGQIMRDQWRASLQNLGVADKDFNVTLADGSKFDIGKDGKNTLKNIDGTERKLTKIDWDNPLQTNAIPMGHLMSIASGLNPTNDSKLGNFDSLVDYSINAASSNAKTFEDVKANYKSMLSNVNPNDLALKTELMRANGTISDDEYNVYLNTINDLYGTNLVADSRDNFVNGFKQRYGNDENYSKLLADDKTYAKNVKRMQDRLARTVRE